MSTQTTGNSEHLIRAELWSNNLKETLKDEMFAQNFVWSLDGFPDGDTFTIPSIGELVAEDYVEDTAAKYRPMDTGEFQFSIDQYIQSGWSITEKNIQDAFYSAQMLAKAQPSMERALMKHHEVTTFAAAEVGVSANSSESIDGFKHRFAGSGAGETMALEDFARARHNLKKANVPDTGLVAIVDPSVEYTLNTLSNLTDVSNNPRWEGIVSDGIATGMKFVKNVYGFDVYTSNYLPEITDNALAVGGSATTKDFSSSAGVGNMFFSTAGGADILPFVGAWRQAPKVDYEFNKDFQRHEYLMTARYGVKKYRPENLITIATKTAV